MQSIHHVLVPTDFSDCAARALAYAHGLAEHVGATLHLLHVTAEGTPAEPGRDRVSELLPDARLPVERVHRVASSAIAGILNYARDEQIDLLVIGTHGRSGIDRILMGSVTEKVLPEAPCPVLTVSRAGEAGRPRRLLAPVDFPDFGTAALESARALARTFGAHLDLLHVVSQTSPPVAYRLPMQGARQAANSRAALREQAAQLFGDEIPYAVHAVVGTPAGCITDFAEDHDTDLIVMATHNRTGLARRLVGSVTEEVIRTAPCPVLTLRL